MGRYQELEQAGRCSDAGCDSSGEDIFRENEASFASGFAAWYLKRGWQPNSSDLTPTRRGVRRGSHAVHCRRVPRTTCQWGQWEDVPQV